MFKNKFARITAIPLLVMGLAPALLTTGCDPEDVCESDLSAKLVALSASVDALVAVSGKLKADVAVACAAIANDLDAMDVPDVGNGSDVSDDDLTKACELANAALKAELDAGITIDIAIEGGHCSVNAQAQFDCEASCSVDGSCDPGTIEARCEPGELSVQCEGTCQANATCQGSVTAEAQCSGTCEGVCNGTCSGSTDDNGKCDGRCEGTCTGDCTLAADANIECGANVNCKGGCDGTFTEPRCEATLEPPSCDLDADCQAGCEGQASFEATCEPPSVAVTIGANGNANLGSTLTENLPKLLNAVTQIGLIGEAGVDVAAKFADAAGDVGGSVLCAVSAAADLTAKATASAAASVSISASFSASASVSGTATGGS